MRTRLSLSVLAAALSLSTASVAFAQDPEPAPAPPLPAADPPSTVVVNAAPPYVSADRPAGAKPEGAPFYSTIRVNGGFRIGYITDGGFDGYSKNDVLPQVSLDATYPLLTRGKLVLGAGLGWDGGGRSDRVRGLSSDLYVHRLSVPLEARYHIVPSIYAFGKVAPGAAAMIATVKEGQSGNELSTTGWAFSADASVGASVLLTPRSRYDRREVRVWITPEFGYGFTTRASLNANPGRDDKDVLGNDENTNLKSLALNGFFWRASAGITF